MNNRKLCPSCGKRAMVRRKIDDRYTLVCEVCGTSRGKFKRDRKIDVV